MKHKYICKIWKEAMKHTQPHKYKDYISCNLEGGLKIATDSEIADTFRHKLHHGI